MATATQEPKTKPSAVELSFPDVAAEVKAYLAKLGGRYTPPKAGAKLPFQRLRVSIRLTDELEERVNGYHRDLATIERRYYDACKLRPVDPSTVTISELEKERDSRRETLLVTLQDSFVIAETGLELIGELIEAWKAKRRDLQDALPALEEKTSRALRKLYPTEKLAPFKGRVSTAEAVVNHRRQISEAGNVVITANDVVRDLTQARTDIAIELKFLSDHYRD